MSAVLVCVRASENHTLGSVLDTCETCQERIWVSTSGQEALANGTATSRMCVPCAQGQEGIAEGRMLEASFDDLRRSGYGDLADFLERVQREAPELVPELLQMIFTEGGAHRE